MQPSVCAPCTRISTRSSISKRHVCIHSCVCVMHLCVQNHLCINTHDSRSCQEASMSLDTLCILDESCYEKFYNISTTLPP